MRFVPFGDPPRLEAGCPSCGALERHRLIWLYFTRETNFLDGTPKRILHFAPEACLRDLIAQTRGVDYVSGDLSPGKALMQLDITEIAFPDASFDVVYASHVLEHVPNDRMAMREIYRVLKPGGWAVLQVPIRGETTDEDLTVVDPEERRRRFGQHDHVRYYGSRDYQERLVGSGFQVASLQCKTLFQPDEIGKFGINANECIWHCTKPK